MGEGEGRVASVCRLEEEGLSWCRQGVLLCKSVREERGSLLALGPQTSHLATLSHGILACEGRILKRILFAFFYRLLCVRLFSKPWRLPVGSWLFRCVLWLCGTWLWDGKEGRERRDHPQSHLHKTRASLYLCRTS